MRLSPNSELKTQQLIPDFHRDEVASQGMIFGILVSGCDLQNMEYRQAGNGPFYVVGDDNGTEWDGEFRCRQFEIRSQPHLGINAE